MKRILVSFAVLTAVTGHSLADGHDASVIIADDNPAAITSKNFNSRWNWTGFQAGVEAGYGWVKDQSQPAPAPINVCVFDLDCEASGNDDVFGLFVGYNHQFGSFVVGGELNYKHHANLFDDGSTVAVKDTTTISGRVGYSFFDRVLAYGFVGGVYGRTSSDAAPFSAVLGVPLAAPPTDQAGWAGNDWGLAYGVGVDMGITENIFVGARYEHQSYKNFNDLNLDAQVDSATVRLGYKF